MWISKRHNVSTLASVRFAMEERDATQFMLNEFCAGNHCHHGRDFTRNTKKKKEKNSHHTLLEMCTHDPRSKSPFGMTEP
jgi:hypothetical protein